jgi:hypothetical protein
MTDGTKLLSPAIRTEHNSKPQHSQRTSEMKKRITMSLFAVVALATSLAASTPAMAASDAPQRVMFYNDGWYYAYADIWGYDANWNETYHGWTGAGGHGFHNTMTVPAGVKYLHTMIRYDPTGEVIHEQWFSPGSSSSEFWDIDDYCQRTGQGRATMYTGGVWHSANVYDMGCGRQGE